jgi:hypothetical protein
MFSKDFWDLDLNFKEGFCIQSLPQNGYIKSNRNKHVIFGDKGKRFFLQNEKKLLPPNTELFQEFARHRNLPIIMNHIPSKFHLKYKKDLDSLLSFNELNYFHLFLQNEVDEFWKVLENKIDLFDELIMFIIKCQMKYFFQMSISKSKLSDLALYEDYFTFGLYISDLEELNKYYSFKQFTNSEITFLETYQTAKTDSNESLFSLFYQKMNNDSYGDVFKLSQFYNLSIAGSTNIAKSFIYLLCFIEENNIQINGLKPSNENDINIITGKFLSELYRLLPFVYNQVVPPFILREVKEDIEFENIKLKAGDDILYYHLLDNLSHQYDDPLKFNPFRLNNIEKRKSSPSFGAGIHRCCGAPLTDIWLHVIFKSFLKNKININSNQGLKHTVYNDEFEMVQKVSYTVNGN